MIDDDDAGTPWAALRDIKIRNVRPGDLWHVSDFQRYLFAKALPLIHRERRPQTGGRPTLSATLRCALAFDHRPERVVVTDDGVVFVCERCGRQARP